MQWLTLLHHQKWQHRLEECGQWFLQHSNRAMSTLLARDWSKARSRLHLC